MILKVNASTKYDIVIEKGARHKLGDLVKSIIPTCKVIVVTDDNIPSQHYLDVINSLE